MIPRLDWVEGLAEALLLTSILLGFVMALAAAMHATRLLLGSRRAAHRKAASPIVLRLAAEEEPHGAAAVDALGRAEWRGVRPQVLRMLGKVRGGGHELLVEALRRHGELRRAERRARGLGSIRRYQAAQVLGAAGDATSVPPLFRLLHDRDFQVRRAAVWALGGVGEPDVARRLLAAAVGRRRVEGGEVAYALARLRGDATRPLIDALDAPDPEMRVVAADALGARGNGRSQPHLIRLTRTDPSVEVRLHALWALTRIGDPAAGAAACEALQDSDAGVRAAAARGAGRIGSPDAVPYLRHGLYDPSVAVAREAALALARLGAAGREVLRAESAGPVAPAARYALAGAAATRREEAP